MIVPAILAHSREEYLHKLKAIDFVAPWIHLDVLDGSRYNTTSFFEEEALFIATHARFELHLMVEKPISLIEKFSDHPNIHRIYFESDCAEKPHDIIEAAIFHGFSVGVVINPFQPLNLTPQDVEKITAIQFMGVNPGKSGQPMKTAVLSEIPKIKQQIADINPDIELSFDGGVDNGTIEKLVPLGISRIVCGSAIFSQNDPAQAYRDLSHALHAITKKQEHPLYA